MFKLRVHSERGDLDLEIVVEGDQATLGRSGDCHVVIDRPDISRRHAEIRRGLVVTDLGSRNGTHVDGARIAGPAAVSRGRFELGDAGSNNLIVVEVLGEPEHPAASPSPPSLFQAGPAPQPPSSSASAAAAAAKAEEADPPAVARLRAELAAEAERHRTQCSRLEAELALLRRQVGGAAADGAGGRTLAEERAENRRLAQRIAELERGRG